MSQKSLKKSKSSKISKYVILNDKFVLSEDLVLDRTFLDDQLISETFQFLQQIQNCEWFQIQQNCQLKLQNWQENLKNKKYNNLYHFLSSVESFYAKFHQQQRFIQHLRDFYPGRNGFFTVDLFSDQPLLDSVFQLEKMRLEKNMLSLKSQEQALKVFDFLQENFLCEIEKEKTQTKSYNFCYDDLSFNNLQTINSFIEQKIITK